MPTTTLEQRIVAGLATKAATAHTHAVADLSDSTAVGRTLLTAADAAAQRTALALGTLATQSGTFSGTHSGASSGTNTGDQTLNAAAITDATTLGRALVTAPNALTGCLVTDGAGALTAWVGQCIRADHTFASNVALAGNVTLDGLTTSAGDIILCTGQTTASQNGLYVASAGAWTRHPLANTGPAIKASTIAVDGKGTNQASIAGNAYRCSVTGDIVIGTTSITYAPAVRYNAGVELNKWGAPLALSLGLFANGGTTSVASINRASGAAGNFDITNTGAGTFRLVTAGVAVLHHPGVNTATGTIFEAHTTGAITIGQALTSGTVTLGNAAGTASHIVQSGTSTTTPVVDCRSAQEGGITGIRAWNNSGGTTSGKYAAIAFAGDAAAFTGGQIRANPTQAFAWNNASQLMEMVFAVGQGVTLTDAAKIDLRGRLTALRGLACNLNYQAPTTGATVTLATTDALVIIEPAGTLAALTVAMPVTPADGQIFTVSFTQIITALTWTPVGPASATFANAPTASATAGQVFRFTYRSATNKWYNV